MTLHRYRSRTLRCGHAEAARKGPGAYALGTSEWLVATEAKYGGLQTNIPRNTVSAHDPRSKRELATGGMIGGDRMSAEQHNYGDTYAMFLKPFLLRDPQSLTVIEIGILKGTGLAIWADLFPGCTLIGLDIDLDHIRKNMAFLKARGAFSHGDPILHAFDQFNDNRGLLAGTLSGRKADIVMDDGFHTEEPIIRTFRSVEPHLADAFVYFVEDDFDAASYLPVKLPEYSIRSIGEISVVTR